jgi:hypothetical protein
VITLALNNKVIDPSTGSSDHNILIRETMHRFAEKHIDQHATARLVREQEGKNRPPRVERQRSAGRRKTDVRVAFEDRPHGFRTVALGERKAQGRRAVIRAQRRTIKTLDVAGEQIILRQMNV